MEQVVRLEASGLVCSGKSTILRIVKRSLRDAGYNVKDLKPHVVEVVKDWRSEPVEN